MNMSHVKTNGRCMCFISQNYFIWSGLRNFASAFTAFLARQDRDKTPGIFKDLFTDNRCYWVWIYYLLFIVMVCISDLIVGGRLTHVEGPLYNLALGIYMLLGY